MYHYSNHALSVVMQSNNLIVSLRTLYTLIVPPHSVLFAQFFPCI